MQYPPLKIPLGDFEKILLDFLSTKSNGTSEYDLIQFLREQDLFSLDSGELLSSDSLVMFRIHFIVFHTLYRLRDRVRQQGLNDIDLNPVCIRLLHYQNNESALIEYDALYEYYMDTENLENTGSEDVDEMLQRFWLRLDNSERRAEALKELELNDPVSDDAIRKQYRRLAMKHHPDRGGEREKLQRINAAVSILLNSYQLDSN
ncbi:MAG: DNA-J related domain-containing protein [Acidiferrobacterales bacterium]|nr:DNA-J related domain-containing protein [Acidiferrobacterales bacterium]